MAWQRAFSALGAMAVTTGTLAAVTTGTAAAVTTSTATTGTLAGVTTGTVAAGGPWIGAVLAQAPAADGQHQATASPLAGRAISGRGVLGLHVDGRSATLTPPSAPTVVRLASQSDCHGLIDPGWQGRCVTARNSVTASAGVVERQAMGGTVAERDLVWTEGNDDAWHLALRRAHSDQAQPGGLWLDQVSGPGSSDLIFVVPGSQPGTGDELDVVDPEGAVALVRDLKGGFATPANGRGLVEYMRQPGGYDQTLLRPDGPAGWYIESEQLTPASVAPPAGGPWLSAKAVAAG